VWQNNTFKKSVAKQHNTFVSKASKKSVAKLHYTFVSKASKKSVAKQVWKNNTTLL